MLLKTAHNTITRLWLQNNKLNGESPKRTRPPVIMTDVNQCKTENKNSFFRQAADRLDTDAACLYQEKDENR